jgi:hypothetical protein
MGHRLNLRLRRVEVKMYADRHRVVGTALRELTPHALAELLAESGDQGNDQQISEFLERLSDVELRNFIAALQESLRGEDGPGEAAHM